MPGVRRTVNERIAAEIAASKEEHRSKRAFTSAFGPDLDAKACALAQAARTESQLDTVNAQLAEGNRLAATALALKNAERKRALAEATERGGQLAKSLDLVANPAVEVRGEGVTLGGD